MRLSATLSGYIGRHFLLSFLALFAAFAALILIIDIVELLRRTAGKPDVGFTLVVEMALLKLPHLGQQIFPFAALFGGMVVFWRLTRSHELDITRAAGVSAWQFLLPVLAIALVLGIFKITLFNPLAATTLSRFDVLEARLLQGQRSSLALSGTGLWLRQAGDRGQTVVHAQQVLQQGDEVELRAVIVFNYQGADHFASRIDAATARLEPGTWRLFDAWVLVPEKAPRHEPVLTLPTDLTPARIQESFSPPETLSFWSLPAFIDTLEKAGFSAIRHRMHWHSLLAAPLLMCAMVLVAATFTLRRPRKGGTGRVIIAGVLTGFVFYFFSDVVLALGLSDSLPVTLAAWAPSGVMTLLGLAMLLHLEDG
ncbi:MAG: LPS export ABC transporter permease LptG [Hyphomicrobiales bacterium]|nr:LPS export ABC transporter permease LptG [Hyphomicrobiales bacterium]MCP5373863.1 LPS export ABC transporter permease LptG [Hyphomicrobiales bacterium]